MGIVRGEEAEEIAEVFQELQKGEEDEEAGEEVRGSASVGLAVCKISGRVDYYCLLSRMGL